MVSTFLGKPLTLDHSAEHIDSKNKNNDIISELTWIDHSGQNKNRNDPEVNLCAYVIVRNSLEMTAKEWVKYLSDEKTFTGRKYTESVIRSYAKRMTNGFSYKVYDDLPDEKWYKVINSENKMGRWEISDHNRIAYVSKFARNVIDANRFGFTGKYPKIAINGKNRRLHDVAFESYYPEEYASKKPGEIILHQFDNKLDFRPHVLRIGTRSENAKDSHDNGRYDGTKSARVPCCSYIDGVFERRHESEDVAAKYLRINGYPNASNKNISRALKALQQNKVSVTYDRTWTFI
jgi:hypothetical protein